MVKLNETLYIVFKTKTETYKIDIEFKVRNVCTTYTYFYIIIIDWLYVKTIFIHFYNGFYYRFRCTICLNISTYN